MYYVTRRSHQMQKYKFGVTCPDARFMETVTGSPEHEKNTASTFCIQTTGMHYVTRRSHRMQNHMFGIMCHDVLFMETTLGPPEHKKSASMFRAPDAPECTT
jgi:hypothetical protein